MSKLLETVETEIVAAIESDKLVLPTLPEVALRIREVAQDDNSSVADLSRVIASDAAISARIIKVCNSPLLRAREAVELAGLTHKIGILPILAFAEHNEDLLSDGFTLDEVINDLHAKLGEMILRAWDFGEELCAVPANYLNFERVSERADFVDVVTVANLQTYAGSSHPLTKLDWSTIPAFAQLGVNPIEEDEDEEEDLSANMEAALALLG